MQELQKQHILEQAFIAFNQQSIQLQESYSELQEQVRVLSSELASARNERIKQLAEKERLASRLEGLLEALPGGVVVLDGDGCIAEYNPAALQMLGEPLEGKEWREVMRRAQATNAEGELKLASGQRISLATRQLVAEPGQIILLTDVTETRHLQSLLERNHRLSEMGEMAARLAHQIRTPLSSAMLYGSHLQRSDIDSPKRKRYANNVCARLQHLERMVDDMLVFARGGRCSSERFDVREMLEEAVYVLEVQCKSGDLVDIEAVSGNLMLQGNREALLGAICNLGTNALQAGDGNTYVRLAAHTIENGVVEISVEDDGPGMAPQTVERVFEPFYTTRPAGTGLGLAVVQSTARAHGGDVRVTSKLNHGTRFTLSIANSAKDEALPSSVRSSTQEQPTSDSRELVLSHAS